MKTASKFQMFNVNNRSVCKHFQKPNVCTYVRTNFYVQNSQTKVPNQIGVPDFDTQHNSTFTISIISHWSPHWTSNEKKRSESLHPAGIVDEPDVT